MTGEAQIELRRCGIDRIRFNCNHLQLQPSGENQVELELRHRVEGSWSDSVAKVILGCHVTVTKESTEPSSDGDHEEIPLDLAVTYFGLFGFVLDPDTTLDEKSKESIKKLLTINATAIIFPYLRAAITSITANAGVVPPVIFPIINVAAMIEQNKSVIEFVD